MKPKRLYWFLSALITITLLILIGGFWYGHTILVKRGHELSQVASELKFEKQHLDQLAALQSQYNAIKPLTARVQSVLPAQKDQAEVVAQISTLVKDTGLKISGLTFDTTQGLPGDTSQTRPASVGGILVMPVSFDTTGRYAQIENLLRSFERQERFMRVSSIEISRNEDGTITSGLVIEVFLKP